MNLKDFLKPTKGKIIVSILILGALNFYILSIPDTNMYFRAPDPVPFSVLVRGEIILYIVSYVISCIMTVTYSMIKKK